ncbi:MAG TPA: iron ABC transporter permease [Anaerolineaceae bacterium]|nr:iron ABC transporter permease [Anaerolineaceae bacterium]
MKNSRRQVFYIVGLVPILFLLAFYVLPLGVVFEKAVQGVQQTLQRADLLSKIGKPLGFTIYQAILSTLLTVLVGFPIAYVFTHFDFKGKKFFNMAVTLPFILPTVVVAAAFNSLLGSHGWLNLLLMNIFNLQNPPIQWMNTLGIILLAHVFYNTSVFVRMVGAAWAQLEVQQEQAARILGANAWQRFRRITLPLLKPSIISALLMVFLFDFTSFGVILLLGGPAFSTLEVEIYLQTTQMLDLPMAGILSMIQLVITFCIAALTLREKKAGSIAFLPDIKNERLQKPRTHTQKVFLAVLLVFVILFFVLPEVSLLLRSLVRLEADRTQIGQISTGFTLDFYKELFQNTRRSLFYVPPIQALKNSVLYALATTLIAGVLGVISAYGLTRVRRTGLLRALVNLPLGTSSVTLGLGFLLTFTRLSFFQDFPQVLVPIAHSLIALPVVISTLYPAFSAIPSNMHAAAGVLGASPINVLIKIDLPLIRRPMLVGALYAFILSLGEFGATSFLTRPAFPTLPVAIYRYLSLPGAMNYGQAMAMACILMLVCAFSMFIMDKFSSQDVVS